MKVKTETESVSEVKAFDRNPGRWRPHVHADHLVVPNIGTKFSLLFFANVLIVVCADLIIIINVGKQGCEVFSEYPLFEM